MPGCDRPRGFSPPRGQSAASWRGRCPFPRRGPGRRRRRWRSSPQGAWLTSILWQREFIEITEVIRLDIDLHRRQQPDDAVVEGDGDDEIGQGLIVQPLPQGGEG